MNDTRILLHPFDIGALDPPSGNVLLLNAPADLVLPREFSGDMEFVQGFRPAFNTLKKSGRSVVPSAEATDVSATLVFAGRHRGQNELWIAEALRRTVAGGLILVAGSKDDGIASLRKRMGELVEIEGSESKYHGVVFWFRRPAVASSATTTLSDRNGEVSFDGFVTTPGMFSHGEIDTASRLLIDHIPGDVSGRVADFCAGWGYLACEVAARCPKVTSIDLYEADQAALEMAKRNLAANAPRLPTRYFWQDLVGERVAERYDAIVMNPPFHTGRAAEPGIGQSLIAVAAKALRKGGRLFVVANRQLPYEQALGSNFARVEKVAEEHGFKVFMAVR
jgi:16S rRNA (guanine1207-N2)-methyltransferase